MTYKQFIDSKLHLSGDFGFEPTWIHDSLFDFQRSLVEWSLRKGRGAIFADCGLGKTPMQLVWAQNVAQHSGGRVLILTPLAVSHQTVSEGQKFGVECARCADGNLTGLPQIVVTNYERLHYFKSEDFTGCVCDESSILKNFDGATRAAVTEFMRPLPYRLLCTATAAPNDYIELGTSSEALGHLPYLDMLKMFFKSSDNSYASGGSGGGTARWFSKQPFGGKFRFRGHAERDFWRWVCSWARAVRKPSDIGFDDGRFMLPELITRQHVVKASTKPENFLFDMPAIGLAEQRAERRRTLNERCEKAAEIACSHKSPVVCWCHLNPEGDMLEKLIPGAIQVSGDDSDDVKEERFRAFESGQARVIVTKPTIAGFGLNWQHCAHQTFFPSHSFEQWYQGVRRSWRFGQENPVTVDVITSEGEASVLLNLQRKAKQAEQMFDRLVALMNNELTVKRTTIRKKGIKVPAWMR